jgi:cytochrome c553
MLRSVRMTPLAALAWLGLAAAAVPARAAGVAEQEFEAVMHAKADSVQGEQLFLTCAACHGSDGAGVSDGSVPAVAGQHFRVLASELVDYRHDRRWDLRMQHFTDEHHLKDAQDIANVASYISGLPPKSAPILGDDEFVQHGAQLYARLCASCHGAMAQGDDLRRVPRLAGQHYAYLLRQMHDAVEGRRPNFPREHVRLLERFELADYVGLANYLTRLGH